MKRLFARVVGICLSVIGLSLFSPEQNIVVYVVAGLCLAGGLLLMTIGKSKKLLAGIAMLWLVQVAPAQVAPDSGWPNYGSDPGGTRYSIARQINRTNVNRLQLAWTYRTGAMQQETKLSRKAAFEATPILVDNKLFLTTPYNVVIALDPQTGVKLWEYDPHVDLKQNYSEVTSRGVSAWQDAKAASGQPCSLRILAGTLDGRLIALDGKTGKPCVEFGLKGEVNLTQNAATATEWTGGYQVTSAPVLAKDLVIVGSSIADNWKVDTGRGVVLAFDARTGSLRWTRRLECCVAGLDAARDTRP